MRRWKTAIKTLVSGFSLPGASFSFPARTEEKPDTQVKFSIKLINCAISKLVIEV